ncbi:MAG: aldo/keto reductase [Actinomycetota bacterium]|nr:aldo/keto reductase [Actinomycetota bacterium]
MVCLADLRCNTLAGTGRPSPGGTIALGEQRVARIGYGTMQLEHAPDDMAISLIRFAVESGVDHFDTASFYGDAVVNRLLARALQPWPDHVVVASKVGARRAEGKSPPVVPAQRPHELREQVELDLLTLGRDRIDVVNLRRMDVGPGLIATGDDVVDLDDQLAALVQLRAEGKIGGVGLSSVTAAQLQQALPAGIVCVQNAYNMLERNSEDVLDLCRARGVAWVPFFPLGASVASPQAPAANHHALSIAADLGATPTQVALTWLLEHYDRTALIPGTRSAAHLTDNLGAGSLRLPPEAVVALDGVARQAT